MKKAYAATYGAVIGLLVTVVHDLLFTKTLKWPASASLTAASFVGIALLLLYEIVGGSRAVTRRSSPISKVEGEWKITLTNNDERPTSVCRIYFPRNDYVYKGYGINADGTLGSEWSSRDVHYDEDQDELSFTSDATVIRSGRRVRNYGYIKFYKDASGKFDYGDGYFVDMADQLTQTHMTLVRIQSNQFDEIVKDAFAKTKTENRAVVQPGARGDAQEGANP